VANSISLGLQNKKDGTVLGSGKDVFDYGRKATTDRNCQLEVQNNSYNNGVSNHSNTMSFDSG
jgi:hypothetical protein